MFEDINLNANSADSSKSSAQFKNTSELKNGIASMVQGWLDPQLSPEVREEHFGVLLVGREKFLSVFPESHRIWRSTVVSLYQVEMPSEEIKYVAGIFIGSNFLFVIDGEIKAPVESGYEHLYPEVEQFDHEKLEKVSLKGWVKLGR